MPNVVHTITLLHSFLWANRYVMGQLTPMQRKMFFLVFIALNPATVYCSGQEVRIPLSLVQKFLGSTSNEKHLPQDLKKGYDAIVSALKAAHKNALIPYIYKGIKNKEACFTLVDTKVFCNLGNKLSCEFNLNEISSYASGSVRDNHTIPLLWYVQCVVTKALEDYKNMEGNTAYPLVEFDCDENGELVKLYITVGHEEIKKIMGYDKFSYTNIPKGNRAFFLDFIEFQERTRPLESLAKRDPNTLPTEERSKSEWAAQKLQEERKAFAVKYGASFSELKVKYNLLWKKIQHRRQPFVDRVMKPATAEINNGCTIYFGEIDNDRRPQRRTLEEIAAGVPKRKAIHELSTVRNNYEMQDTGRIVASCMLLDEDGHIVGEENEFSKVANFRKRRQGEEYTMCVVLPKPLAFAEELEELPFSVGDYYNNDDISNTTLELDEDDDFPVF